MRPLLLLTNDDGVDATGLRALRAALGRFATVVTVAPERNQSAVSHALTLSTVLRLRRLDPRTFAIDGTPADCVYVALCAGRRLLPRLPDMVVAGVNRGPNLGVDVNYSGTVAAAREAALRGIPAVALSADLRADLPLAAERGAQIVRAALVELRHAPAGVVPLLNVNVPARPRSGAPRVTKLGRHTYGEEVEFRTDPRHQSYLWLGTAELRAPKTEPVDADTRVFHEGRVGISPLRIDTTATEHQELVGRIVARWERLSAPARSRAVRGRARPAKARGG